MATVTGMTASAMQAIRDGTIVNGAFDSAGHLILTKYDGTQIDAGAVLTATSAQAGVVELATNAETLSGTDATRAVTPAGLASIPGYKVQLLASNSLLETDGPDKYPQNISLMSLISGSGWTPANGIGNVVTNILSATTRVQQTFYATAGGTLPIQIWTRSYHSTSGGGGWTPWQLNDVINNLTPASFLQSTALASYPLGWSRLYFTSTNSTGWDFSGSFGEVMTYRDGTDFARQIWTKHSNGTSTAGETWFRLSNSANGWSPWFKTLTDPGAWVSYTPTWTTSSGVALPSFGNATVDCRYNKIGRTVNVRFEIQFGSTTNFGSGATGTDNWRFGLPVAAARSTDSLGFAELIKDGTNYGLARLKATSTTQFALGVVSGSANITSDVDSTQPWVWANGNAVRGNFVYESAS